MSYLNAQTLEKSILGKSVLVGQPLRIQQCPNLENVPGIKMKAAEQFANADLCNICKQPFSTQRNVNRHHCRLCGVSVCGECSRKKVNSERSCDFCFLKLHLKKQEHERKENFRLRQQNIEKMNREIKEFQADIENLDKEIISIDKANVEMEVTNAKQLIERQQALREGQQAIKIKQQACEQRRKQLVTRKEQLDTREERNKMYSSKVQIVKLDISSKQSALLEKMEELERLKLQLGKLEEQRKQLLAEFK